MGIGTVRLFAVFFEFTGFMNIKTFLAISTVGEEGALNN